jgi:hypothetical protein
MPTRAKIIGRLIWPILIIAAPVPMILLNLSLVILRFRKTILHSEDYILFSVMFYIFCLSGAAGVHDANLRVANAAAGLIDAHIVREVIVAST